MKNLTLTLAMLLSILCSAKSSKSSVGMANAYDEMGGANSLVAEQPTIVPDYFEYDFDKDGVMDRAELRESVYGDFNGDGESEYASLYAYIKVRDAEAEDWDYYKYYHHYVIVFGDKRIPMVDLPWSGCNLINEGDLNGDGAEEIALFNWGGYSAWGTYVVYTYNSREWQEFIAISHNEDWNQSPYQDLVQKDPHNEDYVIIQEIRCDDGKIMNNRVLLANLPMVEEVMDDRSRQIKEIDTRLASLLAWERDTTRNDYELQISLQREFEREMGYYLQDPITFTESLPQLSKMIFVLEMPSRQAKFYSYWVDGGGTMSDDKNFIQYVGDDGNVYCKPFLNDLRYPRGICNVWEFKHDGEIYYALQTYHRGMSCCWDYYLEIISIDNGEIKYHTEFFSKDHGYIYDSEEYYIYDDKGEIVGQAERPTYYIVVCGTQTTNCNVGFDFDPTTLTVKVKDDGDWTGSRTGAVIESEWRLNVAK